MLKAVNCEEGKVKTNTDNANLLNLNFDSVSQSDAQHGTFSKQNLKATWRRVTMELPLTSRSLIIACFTVLILWNITLTIRLQALNSKQTAINSVLLSSNSGATKEKIQILEKKIETLEDLQSTVDVYTVQYQNLTTIINQHSESLEFVENEANQIKIGAESIENLRLEGGKIWFQDSNEVSLTEEPTSTSRQWSQSSLQIQVGTAVTWTWVSNENVVEATESYSVRNHPSFKSGPLQKGGSFTYTFEEAGTYYFVSENTAGMRGSVTVKGFYADSGDLHIPGDLYLGGAMRGSNITGTIQSICLTPYTSEEDCCPSFTNAHFLPIETSDATVYYHTWYSWYGTRTNEYYSFLSFCLYA